MSRRVLSFDGGLMAFGGDDLAKARKLAKRRKFQGLDISVETAKGSYRHWYDPQAGEHGKTKMLHDYGYIRGSVGADAEHVDCYVGPSEQATHAYVIDQMKKPDFMSFDEQKVMLGFDSEEAAKRAYLACYNDPRFLGGMRAVPMADFKRQVLATSEHQPLTMSEPKADRLPGGLADKKKPSDFDAEQLAAGIKVELEHTSDRALAREIAMDHLTEDADYYRKLARIEKSFPRLTMLASVLLKSDKPPAGFSPIPMGRKGGYRKRTAKGWIYWYPTAGGEAGKHAPAQYGESDFASGEFDTTPSHWHFIRQGSGTGDIYPWTAGGIDPQSHHPVKIAGQEARLYQIANPEGQDHMSGMAQLRDANSGETTWVKHDRIYPVEHSRARPKRPGKPRRRVAGDDPTQPPPGPKIGWVPGSETRLQPYPDSRAPKGTILYRVERGHYPRKTMRVWREDADGVPRREEEEVLAMPEGDKVKLLGELQGLLRKAADTARRKFAMDKTPERMEDLHAAAMEGLLHAIDKYKGGYSFAKSASGYAQNHARLQAAREFVGGVGMSTTDARLMPGFIAARTEAGRVHQQAGGTGEPPIRLVAETWRVRKRDRHRGLTGRSPKGSKQANQLIPMTRYSLRDGEIVGGKDNPGRLELAEAFTEFLSGQRSEPLDFGTDSPLLPGAETGFGLGATEKLEWRHDLELAMEVLKRHDVVVGSKVYITDGAEILRRRLGLDADPQSARAVAAAVPIYRIQRGGALKQLSPRAAHDVIGPAVEQAIDRIREKIEGPLSGMLETAKTKLVEPQLAPPGPTWKQHLEAEGRKVTREDVRQWRASEREKLRRLEDRARSEGDTDRADYARRTRERIKTIGFKEARRHIAEMRIANRPASREWFRTATPRPVNLIDPRNEYGSATILMTDPATGRQRHVKIRTIRDFTHGEQAYKSEGGAGTVPSMAVLRMVTLFPRLARTLYGSDDAMAYVPSRERAAVMEAMGL
jgi:hypothetical protein